MECGVLLIDGLGKCLVVDDFSRDADRVDVPWKKFSAGFESFNCGMTQTNAARDLHADDCDAFNVIAP